MHEDLLGYLLGALEQHEMRRVAQWLRDDPAAREQLAEIERSLKPLEETYQAVDPPPPDLVSRTLASLPPLPTAAESADASDADEAKVTLPPMGSGIDAPRSHSTTWLDWVGGATAAAVILGLMLPMLAEGRFESRRVACQDQLRQFGTAITQFVNRNQQQRLPAVSASGPEAFAGVYAVRLNDAGLLADPSIRWCPSLNRPALDGSAVNGSASNGSADDGLMIGNIDQLVPLDELHEASVDRLRQIQQFAGGHYAYTLGVMEQNQLAPPRFESRSSFAVMSDAPLAGLADRVALGKQIGHSGAGINVLFEDGRVKFIPILSLERMPDHPLLNHRGQVEAGVNVDDASLAPSWRPPFVDVKQR